MAFALVATLVPIPAVTGFTSLSVLPLFVLFVLPVFLMLHRPSWRVVMRMHHTTTQTSQEKDDRQDTSKSSKHGSTYRS